jgi:hypothetical protein
MIPKLIQILEMVHGCPTDAVCKRFMKMNLQDTIEWVKIAIQVLQKKPKLDRMEPKRVVHQYCKTGLDSYLGDMLFILPKTIEIDETAKMIAIFSTILNTFTNRLQDIRISLLFSSQILEQFDPENSYPAK